MSTHELCQQIVTEIEDRQEYRRILADARQEAEREIRRIQCRREAQEARLRALGYFTLTTITR